MKNGFSANFRNCATCDFWTGSRSLNSTRTRAEYNAGVNGDCLEGGRKITHKSPTATCHNWQKWGQLKSATISKGDDNKKKGIIPYPVFVGLILLAAIINFARKNIMYIVPIGIILIACILVCIFLYRKAQNPKKKIFITILVGIVLVLGVFYLVPTMKGSPQFKQEQSEVALKNISTSTVFGWYKPTFGSNNIFSSDYSKIAVNGNIEYSAYSNYYSLGIVGSTENLRLDTDSVNKYFLESTGKDAPRSTSIGLWGILLLTKINDIEPTTYAIDKVIQYQYSGSAETDLRVLVKEVTSPLLIQYSERNSLSELPILDTWILENVDK